ncbi:MAG TPA: DUF87 domain-containing protein [Thermoplasmata archaeon]|nr:DUF87 domain-containing protein [Thermoplasmata archaeon]
MLEFRRRLRLAVRAAQGLRLRFRIEWASGPGGGVRVGSSSRAARRWVGRTLAGCYQWGQWIPLSPTPPAPGSRVLLRGRLAPSCRLPELPADEAPGWTDAVHRSLPEVPAGVRVSWDAVPCPPTTLTGPQPPPVEDISVPPNSRLAPLTSEERNVREQLAGRRRADWLISVEIEARGASTALAARVGELVRIATQGAAGTSLSWARGFPWIRPAARWYPVTEGEVTALFPDRWSPAGSSTSIPGPGDRIPVGRSTDGGTVAIEVPTDEGRHLCVLGETGMGKSTALVALALHAARRHGVVLFDPIGDTARRFEGLLPAVARSRLLHCSPVDSSVSLNAIEGVRPTPRGDPRSERTRLDLVTALRRVRAFRYTDAAFWGPRVEDVLGRAIQAAALIPNGTLDDAALLLEGRPDSVHLAPGATLPSAAEALLDVARFRPEEVDGTRRLLTEVTRNETLHRMLCDRRATHRAADLVQAGRITVISGEAPLTGELTTRYLLAIDLALVWAELLARTPASKCFLILDEAQWYAHESVAEILRLGRRSNVHLVLATQALAALPEAVREALLTNAADFLLFRGSPDDAREFARWQGEVDAAELLSLDRGEAVLLLGKGRRSLHLRAAPIPPPAEDPPVSSGTPPSAAPPPDGPPATKTPLLPPDSGADPPTVEELLRAAADAGSGMPLLEFPLTPCRARVDPSGEQVRAVGRRLQRVGALRDRRRDPRGPVWVLDRTTLLEAVPAFANEARAERVRQVWAEIEAAASARRESF